MRWPNAQSQRRDGWHERGAARALYIGALTMIEWFVQTLRTYPEIAIFLSLALGYYFGSFTYKGLGLGVVTATLIAAVIIGQLKITITGPLKPTFFLLFLFAIGYGVGPQFL